MSGALTAEQTPHARPAGGQANPDTTTDWTRMVRRFAHDLNSELQPVLSLSGLALEDLPPESETWADLQLVHDAAHRAAELVTRMSGFAHRGTPPTIQAAVLSALAQIQAEWGEVAELRLTAGASSAFGPDLLVIKDLLVAALDNLERTVGHPAILAVTIDETAITLSADFTPAAVPPGTSRSVSSRRVKIDTMRTSDTACRIILTPE